MGYPCLPFDEVYASRAVTNCRHGFVNGGRSTTAQLLHFLDKLTTIIDRAGNYTDVVHLGFSEAFDSVPHQRLISKLKSLGIAGKVLDRITGFLKACGCMCNSCMQELHM